MEQRTAIKATMALMAIKSFIVGAVVVLFSFSLTPMVSALGAVPGGSAISGPFSLAVTVMWILGIVELLLGISAIITAVAVKK